MGGRQLGVEGGQRGTRIGCGLGNGGGGDGGDRGSESPDRRNEKLNQAGQETSSRERRQGPGFYRIFLFRLHLVSTTL